MNPDQLLDALLSLPELEGARVSNDGAWVAWTWYRAGPTADVYAAPADGSCAPVRLTNTDQNTVLVGWAPDSRAVLVQHDHEGDERVQLFRVDLAQPELLVPLTEPAPQFYIHGGQLDPGGRRLVYGANFDFERGEEIEPTWIYRHDLDTGKRLVLAKPEQPTWISPDLNQQGTQVLYSRADLHPAGQQLWLVDIDGTHDREILNACAEHKLWASWLPDGRRVLVTAEMGSYRRVGVWEPEREGQGMAGVRWLIDDPERNIELASVPRGSTRPIAVLIEQRGAHAHASQLDLETGVETRLPPVAGDLIPLYDLGDGWWVGEYASATQPGDLVRFRWDDPRPEVFVSLTRLWERTALQAHNLVAVEDFRWKSVDGLEIQGWLYRAKRAARGTIALIHGGPTWHSHDAVDNQIQYLLAQGFHVLAPNYRGSTGFSLQYQESIKEDGWGGREQDDIRTGLEALVAAGIAQPGKIGVTGTSYGGYSSWCQITRYPPELVAAAAPICGMTDLVVDYETTRPDLRSYSAEMMGGTPEEVPERYRERSPLHALGNIRGRLLIVQGMRDPNVTPENVHSAVRELQRAGVEYQILAFEDEGHGVHRRENQRILYRRLAEFFGEAFGERGSDG